MHHQVAALALTIALEGAGMLAFSLAERSQRRRAAKNLALVVALNAVTHTIFWNLFPLAIPFGGSYFAKLLAAECIVSVIEGGAYRYACGLRTGAAMALGFALNALSWQGGVAILGMLAD